MAKSALQKRTRAWATIVYEESAPENWREKLQGYMVQTFVSPLHDADVKEDGSAKKPHWHVLMMYDGVKTPEQAREVFESFGGVGCTMYATPTPWSCCALLKRVKKKFHR